jgi:hypothetical protein
VIATLQESASRTGRTAPPIQPGHVILHTTPPPPQSHAPRIVFPTLNLLILVPLVNQPCSLKTRTSLSVNSFSSIIQLLPRLRFQNELKMRELKEKPFFWSPSRDGKHSMRRSSDSMRRRRAILWGRGGRGETKEGTAGCWRQEPTLGCSVALRTTTLVTMNKLSLDHRGYIAVKTPTNTCKGSSFSASE